MTLEWNMSLVIAPVASVDFRAQEAILIMQKKPLTERTTDFTIEIHYPETVEY
jgi:hypothetical protein